MSLADGSRLVVGAAIVRDGRVLAARRAAPDPGAGRWELPGGQVEPGESPRSAVVREIGEELGCRIVVRGLWDLRSTIRPGLVLVVAVADLLDSEPRPLEHDALWWLLPDELDRVAWAAADLPFLPLVRTLLEES